VVIHCKELFQIDTVALLFTFLNTSRRQKAVFIFVNNSCLSSQRASANGIAQSLVSIGRIIGPLVGGMAFAWYAMCFPLRFLLVNEIYLQVRD
jgi:hypothetical protein